ncbi:hypothetical protein M1316_01385, partial [Candidatus Parvarchaeota archaeon]|nr:hypothetical protein [Candidatus Parvarchaeota archaeon]
MEYDLKGMYANISKEIKKGEISLSEEKLNVVCVISDFLSVDDDLGAILKHNNFTINKVKENYAIIKTKCFDSVLGKELDVIYHLKIFKEERLLLFLTTSKKDFIEKTLFSLIDKLNGFNHLFISPKAFTQIQEKIFADFPDTLIPFFSAYRRQHFKFPSKIRPEEQRTITYRGLDGRETLEELKQFYGILPRIVEFRIPDVIQFKLDYRGIFAFEWGEIDYIDKIIAKIAATILNSRKIAEGAKIQHLQIENKNKKLETLQIKKCVIRLSRKIEYEDVYEIIKTLGQE